MVTISDINGVNLVLTAPQDLTFRAGPQGVTHQIEAVIAETNTMLPEQNLSGTVNWNDGGPVEVFAGTNPLVVSASRVLRPGQYYVSLYAHDYELPTPFDAQVNYGIRVLPALELAPPQRIIYGPILPRDAGFPGAQDWLFDTSSDIFILESSVKMLLSTAKGERIMEPEYGTNLKRLLFETNAASIDSLIQQEIADALARWEPRVVMQFFNVTRDPNNREVTVVVALVSKLSGNGFELTLNFQP